MAVRAIGATYNAFVGLASDEKPTAGVDAGATFFSIDSGERWIYFDGTWRLDLRTEELGIVSIGAKAQRIFSVASPAPVNTSAGTAASFSGLGIANPIDSGFDITVLWMAFQQCEAGDPGTIGIQCTEIGAIAPQLTPQNQYLGSPVPSIAYAFSTATIIPGALHRLLGYGGGEAEKKNTLLPGILADLRGTLIVAPGQAAMTFTEQATTGAFMASFTWAEVVQP